MATPRLIGAAVLSCLVIAHASPAPAASGRAAALAEIEVNEVVDGDVVALGGDVVLGPDASVHGHVVAVFGEVRRHPGAQVDGRVIALSSLAELRLAPEGEQAAHLQIAVRLLGAGAWLLATTLVAFFLPGRVRFGVWLVPTVGLKILVLGVLVFITLYAALVAFVGLGPTLGVPLVGALMVASQIARAVGLAVLGAALGGPLLARIVHRPLPVTVEVFVGVSLLLALRFVPVAGEVVWTGLSVVALGAAVFTVALAPNRRAAEPASTTGGPRR
jgi:hypothetical protein